MGDACQRCEKARHPGPCEGTTWIGQREFWQAVDNFNPEPIVLYGHEVSGPAFMPTRWQRFTGWLRRGLRLA